MNRTHAGLLGLFVLFASPAGAASRESIATAEARLHLERAALSFRERRFGEAIDEWKAAHRLRAVPTILLNIAQAARLSGRLVLSRDHYVAFLNAVPESPHREELRARIVELDQRIARAAKAKPSSRAAPPPAPSPPAPTITANDDSATMGAAPIPPTTPTATAPANEQAPDATRIDAPADDPQVETRTAIPPSSEALDPRTGSVAPSRLRWLLTAGAGLFAIAGGITYGGAQLSWSEARDGEHSRAEADRLLMTGDQRLRWSLGLTSLAASAGVAALLVRGDGR